MRTATLTTTAAAIAMAAAGCGGLSTTPQQGGSLSPDPSRSGTWDYQQGDGECEEAYATPLTEGEAVLYRLPFGGRNVGLLLTFPLPPNTREVSLILEGDFSNTFCCGQDVETVLLIRTVTFEEFPESQECCGCEPTALYDPPVNSTGGEILAVVQSGEEEVAINVTDLLPANNGELQLYVELAPRDLSSGDVPGEIGLIDNIKAYLTY